MIALGIEPEQIMRLYHFTSPSAALEILKNKKMLRGSSGMHGGGIYFAEILMQANRKAQNTGPI